MVGLYLEKGCAHDPRMPPLVSYARDLRREQTDAERLLWGHLRDRRLNGFKFRRQVPSEPFIVDFACIERGLVVELDGSQHGEDRALAYDERRTAVLNARGMRVMRFWNEDVLKDLSGVLNVILFELEAQI
jgi:very-short-patch-repair endonuclease